MTLKKRKEKFVFYKIQTRHLSTERDPLLVGKLEFFIILP